MNETRLRSIQEALAAEGLDAWFFSDFKGTDPIALSLLGLPEKAMRTRRWFYLIPAHGDPLKLCHAIEPASLDHLPGRRVTYGRWQEWQEALAKALSGMKRVAAQYAEDGLIPAVGRLDAGLADFLRSRGVVLVSSGDLVARFEVTLSPEQEAGHRRAVRILEETVDMAFARVRASLQAGTPLNEYALQQEMAAFFEGRGLTTMAHPIVAVNAHAADPHFEPAPDGSAVIGPDSVLLLDLWAKETGPGSVYGDLTWCAWTGARVPEEQARVWEAVTAARDAGVAKAKEAAVRPVAGWEVDRAARDVIEKAGYGAAFFHRTGHSIYVEDHGNGANMDDFETRDTRRLLPHTVFSVEPGIYFPGRYGFRSEVNCLVGEGSVEVTGKSQGALPALLG
ncbi:MAG: M24 family metallopeptidase [Acidobacteriota bacterium]